jgi:hypothetical protein
MKTEMERLKKRMEDMKSLIYKPPSNSINGVSHRKVTSEMPGTNGEKRRNL